LSNSEIKMTTPVKYKALDKTMKLAAELGTRGDMITVYWLKFYAVQEAMKIDSKANECRSWLIGQMDALEQIKKSNPDTPQIHNEQQGKKAIELRALTMFAAADKVDREMGYGKVLVKRYFSAAIMMESLRVFGEASDDFETKIKYAKWRATHIHSRLSQGQQPDPVFDDQEDELLNEQFDDDAELEAPEDPVPTAPTPSFAPPTPITPFVEPVAAPRGNSGGFVPSDENKSRAQKLAKFAVSSLDYDDVPGAIGNLKRAMALLETGAEQ